MKILIVGCGTDNLDNDHTYCDHNQLGHVTLDSSPDKKATFTANIATPEIRNLILGRQFDVIHFENLPFGWFTEADLNETITNLWHLLKPNGHAIIETYWEASPHYPWADKGIEAGLKEQFSYAFEKVFFMYGSEYRRQHSGIIIRFDGDGSSQKMLVCEGPVVTG